MRTISLHVDIAPAMGGTFNGAAMAVNLYAPDEADLPANPIVVFAVPGGGYGRGYFDMHFAEHDGYSQAEHHAAHGIITVAVDHLGVGESSTDWNSTLQFEDLAQAYNACVSAVVAKLRMGDDTGLPPISPAAVLGIGQSMGGCVTILTQAAYRSFDGIGILGFSAIHTRLPQKETTQELANAEQLAGLERGSTGRGAADTVMADHVYPFHFEDVPPDIIHADMVGGYPIRENCPPFGSATIPDCVIQMLLPGVVAKEAASIAVPVFIGNGERDVCPDPRMEPTAFGAANDIATIIVPNMAHMHNFASSRAVLWDRLAHWYHQIADLPAQRKGDI